LNFGNQQSLERRLITFSRATAVLSVAVGFLVLFGWIFDLRAVISISPGLATMKVNTAIAFLLSGIALWSANPLRGVKGGKAFLRISRACAILVAVIGLLTLCEFLFGWEPGIDNLIVRDRHTVHTPHPGRMSPFTALGFLLFGTAFLIMDFETRGGQRPAQWLMLPIFLDGFIALLGHAYGVRSFYHVGPYASMALHTAILAVMVSLGFLCARPGKGLMVVATDTTAGGWIFRHFLPAALIVTPVLGWLRLLGQKAGLYGLEFGTALLVMSNATILSGLIWWAARFIRAESLDRAETQQRMERDQKRANEQTSFLERRVRERTARLRETVTELERSSHTISHNLRAPVRAVLAFAEFLMTDFGEKLGESGRDYVDRIKVAAQRMDALIEDVLAYTQVSGATLHVSAVDLDTLVEAVVPEYRRPGTEIQISHPLGKVRANESFLTLAVSNLIDNAIKFVRPGTKPEIEVWSQSDNGKVRLVVHDHGIGVPAESGDKIFRTFERAHEGYPGTGIGLALVKRAVERMEGSVGFDSKAGEGSSFWVELPKA
jgi:signal transduction histidine kinase